MQQNVVECCLIFVSVIKYCIVAYMMLNVYTCVLFVFCKVVYMSVCLKKKLYICCCIIVYVKKCVQLRIVLSSFCRVQYNVDDLCVFIVQTCVQFCKGLESLCCVQCCESVAKVLSSFASFEEFCIVVQLCIVVYSCVCLLQSLYNVVQLC